MTTHAIIIAIEVYERLNQRLQLIMCFPSKFPLGNQLSILTYYN